VWHNDVMTPQEIEQTIREYIDQIIHMSLATCADNAPWVCEVHFAVDDELNIYFRSLNDTRHCQEIAQNPNVAGNIVTQHFKNQRVRGVYYEGIAELLTDITEDHPGVRATAKRYGEKSAIQAVRPDNNQSHYYKITVKNWYLFDSYGTEAGKHQLPWKQA
jgi:uncharacterized protein YhbP (UPF0306 family)